MMRPVPRYLAETPSVMAAYQPGRTALICGEERLSYSQFAQRCARLAAALATKGIGRGDRVAWLGRNSPRFFELLFACAALRAIAVPLNWRLATPELQAVIADAAPSLVIVEPAFYEDLQTASPGLSALTVGEDYERLLAAATPSQNPDEPPAEEVVLMLYTSGTTGKPKGVCLSNRALQAHRELEDQWGSWYRWREGEVILLASPVFHIGGTGWGLQGFHRGAAVVCCPDSQPESLLDAITRHRVNRSFMAPVLLRWLIDQQQDAAADLSSLRMLLYGAAVIPPETLREAMRALPRCGFVNMYGMTETGGTQICLTPDQHDLSYPERLASCGRPASGVEVAVRAPDGGDCSPGEIGEIVIRSDCLMSGYWGQPRLTAEVVQRGWYYTGDAGTQDYEGFLTVLDRVRDMIITGGENVFPAEIENVLAQYPGVQLAIAAGVPHPDWGQALVACVQADSRAVDERELRGFLRERIAGYKVPKALFIRETLPVNAAGKPDRRRIAEELQGLFAAPESGA